MKNRSISLGCWLVAILIVFPLYILAYLMASYWIILVAVVLAALDAKRIRVWRYESDIAQKPSMLFLLMLVLGWLILPWYVGLRLKILAGTARLKEEYRWQEAPVVNYQDPTPPPGLIQPWSTRWRRRFWRSTVDEPRRK